MSTTVEELEKTETSEAKKDELLLDSLEIKGYRCFEHLTIEKLGRVNLIVGKNNVGKTALLEALWIYANGSNNVLDKILESRKENLPYKLYGKDENPKIRHLFFGRDVSNKKIQIGENNNYNYITLISHNDNRLINEASYPLDDVNKNSKKRPHIITNFFVNIGRLDELDVDILWEKVELTILEDKVLESLRLILPELLKIRPRIVENQGTNLVKVVYAQSRNNDEPFTLKSYGEGLNRLFEISLTLVSCKNGILLIDEIESGLHYSVLPDVWKLIFKTAKDLNVQVFATTHSKDCIEAFTQAAIDYEESDGMLIRLENKDGTIRAVNFNEDELETIERRNIEVR